MEHNKRKGSLSLKSSALAPTACKLSSQFLVMDHMSNHYKKIARAKSAIDSRPPKSIASSQKMRDRVSRDKIGKSPRSRAASSASNMTLNNYENLLQDEPEDEDEKLVYSIMRSTLLDKNRGDKSAVHESLSFMEPYGNHKHYDDSSLQTMDDLQYTFSNTTLNEQPTSVRSVKSGLSLMSSSSRAMVLMKRICNGDVLEKRPHLFTEPEKPFTPRTLKKNTESKLKHSKCYNPPPHLRSRERSTSLEESNTTMRHKQESPPRSQQRMKKPTDPSPVYQEDQLGTPQLTDSMLTDITLQSRGHVRGAGHDVPPLAISVDKDHMNWLQEQATKAEVRARIHSQLKSSISPPGGGDKQARRFSRSRDQRPAGEVVDKQKNLYFCRLRLPGTTLSSWISQRLMEEEEEQKYLTFAKEVTDDVLSRGISADRVLSRVFENHIERRKGDLDEERMRKVIKDLQKRLGLRDTIPEAALATTFLKDGDDSHQFSTADITASSQGIRSRRSSHTSERQGNKYKDTLADPDLDSTLGSVSSLKFGQTVDALSTIQSESGRPEEKDQVKDLAHEDGMQELTGTQTLRQYQLRLTAMEDNSETRNKATGSSPVSLSSLQDDMDLRETIQDKSSKDARQLSRDGLIKSNKFRKRPQQLGAADTDHQTPETVGRMQGDSISSAAFELEGRSLDISETSTMRSQETSSLVSQFRGNGPSTDRGHDYHEETGEQEVVSPPVPRPRGKLKLEKHEESLGKTDNKELPRNESEAELNGRSVGSFNRVSVEEKVTNEEESPEQEYEYEEDYEEDIENEDGDKEDSGDDF